MKKVLLILSLISSLWLGGCSNDRCDCDCDKGNKGNNDASLLVGSWEMEEFNYTFNNNNTGIHKDNRNGNETNITWKIYDDFICIYRESGLWYSAPYFVNETTLLLNGFEFNRKS